jgi:hypothetical protein
MKLNASDVDLTGKWVVVNDRLVADPICQRIEWLTLHHLTKIAISQQGGGGETLFQDPDDERFWECTYPQGHTQGGGPPRLTALSPGGLGGQSAPERSLTPPR